MDETRFTRVDGGLTAAQGFRATGVSCGLKEGGYKDIGLVYSEKPCVTAASFTGNRVKAHPVLLDIDRLKKDNKISAIIVNSGNANCITGKVGDENALRMAELTEKYLDLHAGSVLVASTGVIGVPLIMDRVEYGIEKLTNKIKAESDCHNFAFAIMTTDTREKHVAVEFKMGGKTVRIGLTAKGAGMLKPRLETLHATMLVFITTDVAMEKSLLQEALKNAVEFSFNRICVDNDTSTNDSVFLMSNGMAKNHEPEKFDDDYQLFCDALQYICTEAAKLLVKDGEGANKLIELRIMNAVTASDAKKIAVAISESYLVKTAFYGGDPNWGRILAAAGYSDAKIDVTRMRMTINGILIFEKGAGIQGNRGSVASELTGSEVVVEVDLGLGSKDYTMWTCDLSHDYVKINAHYTT